MYFVVKELWHNMVGITAQYSVLSWMPLKRLMDITTVNCSDY